MYAVIHEIESISTHGLIPIAGRPLVARQIQWLRSSGCQDIAVQIGSSAESIALGQWLARGDAVGTNVRLVASGKSLTPREIARRAGFPDAAQLLAIPADTLCGGDIAAMNVPTGEDGTLVALPAPQALADVFDGSCVRMFGNGQSPTRAIGEAWAIRVGSLADAFVIGVAVLEGRLESQTKFGILVHASERERGIWVSRGARIDPRAKLIAPVLVGAETVIRAHAIVGPRVFLGDRSVVEQRTRLTDSFVAPETIVGEDLDLSGMAIDTRGMQDLSTGEHATITETLLVAPRNKPYRGHWFGRGLALFLLVVLAPIWLVSGMMKLLRAYTRGDQSTGVSSNEAFSALVQTIRGRRSCIGLSDWTEEMPLEIPAGLVLKAMMAPIGLFVIDRGLVPEDADSGTRIRARVYYMYEKNLRLDLVLVWRCLRHLVVRCARKTMTIAPSESQSPMKAGI
jgi:hypothetical protein